MENTDTLFALKCQGEDHLHIRGEYELRQSRLILTIGSPPHTWRILLAMGYWIDEIRITSTYVENTVWQFGIDGYYWDHLHIRGEY